MDAASFSPPAGLLAARTGRLLRLRSDDQLVALFRLGNEEAFRVIHDRYRARLFAYTRQMLAGSRSDAEDALQDVFLRAYGALRADDRPVTLRAWLYRVAHNRCVDHLRRPANQPTGELYENLASLQDPLADAQRRDDLRRLVADVRALPEQQRSALLMRELEGLTYAELADALAVTIPSVKSLLVRARIGLTEAREARDTACVEIRADLVDAHDRGVRVNSRARRHLGECSCCTDYRARLRGVREGFAALGGASPTGLGLLAKLLGLGSAGGGAAAAGGGGGVLVAGGTAKVAALVCCAAVVGGGAVEASRELGEPPASTSRAAAPAAERGTAGERRRAPSVAGVRADAPRPGSTPVATRIARPAAASRTREVVVRREGFGRTPSLRAASPLPAGEAPTVGGSPADEDVQQAAAVGGALAPEEPGEPAAEAAPAVAPDEQPEATITVPPTPTGITGP